jgi:hypothetical protein
MNDQHSYLLVEGPQDVLFVARILQQLGLRIVERVADIPPKWRPFVAQPAHQRDQAQRQVGREGVQLWQMFRPTCLLGDDRAVIIEPVNGNRAKFGRTLRATKELIDGGLNGLAGVAMLPDADADALTSFRSAQGALRSAGLSAPEQESGILLGAPSTGIFVLPGGFDPGGLEDLLSDCADQVYPDLMRGARRFVGEIDPAAAGYAEEDMRKIRTPRGRLKAVVGCVSSVLKPGSTVQVSVRRDRWICEATLGTPRVSALVRFLRLLCALP